MGRTALLNMDGSAQWPWMGPGVGERENTLDGSISEVPIRATGHVATRSQCFTNSPASSMYGGKIRWNTHGYIYLEFSGRNFKKFMMAVNFSDEV